MNVLRQITILKNSNSYHEFMLNTALIGLSKAAAHKILTNCLTGYLKPKTRVQTANILPSIKNKAFQFMKQAFYCKQMNLKTIFKNIELII